jgi:hypothetical protein
LGIDLAVDEGNQVGDCEAIGDVGDAEVGDSAAMLGVTAGEAPDDWAAPIVTDPNGAVAAEMREQVEHVGDTVFERVSGMRAVDRRTTVAAHVGGDTAEAERAKAA